MCVRMYVCMCICIRVRRFWVWKYAEDLDEFIFSIGGACRLRVKTINFTKQTTTAKGVESTTVSESKNEQVYQISFQIFPYETCCVQYANP